MNVDKNLTISVSDILGLRWIDPLKENVKFYGFNWLKENNDYYRLPKSRLEEIKAISPQVAYLAGNTAGGQLHFTTNTKRLVIHVKIKNCGQLSGMTFVGQGGFDCYVGSSFEDLKFYDTARFDITKSEYEFTLFNAVTPNPKQVLINFPLYANVEELLLAIDEDAYIAPPNDDLGKMGKIVMYGTSILQGGCASRPGLAYSNLISRRLKQEVINLGFSGNAFGEELIAQIMADITDATMFIVDYEANAGTNGKLELTLEPFIKTLRSKHPKTPILVVSRIKYLFDDLNPALGKRREQLRLFQKRLVEKFQKNGDDNIYYVNGSKLLGPNYHEFTIDSIHPNDLGFMMMANNLEKIIKKVLEKEVK